MSNLVERVAIAIAMLPEGQRASSWHPEARAAIRAVAEWLDAYHKANFLANENHSTPELLAQLKDAPNE